MAAWYRQGTIALTNGAPTITGTLTGWVNQVKAGDALLAPDGKWYEVATDPSVNTTLTLATNYTGSTASGQSYAINRCSTAWGQASSIASAVSALLAILPVPGGALEALKSLRTNATGTAYALGGSAIATSIANRLAKFTGTTGDVGQAAVMFEDGSGNVGIGTDTPSTRLNVVGPDRYSAPHQVYLMGDSLTSPSAHYGTQLATRLGSNWSVNWRGISGNTTTQMLARFTTDVIAPGNGEYVVIWGGVNDIAQGATAATIKANLQAMYDAAHANRLKVIAVNISPFSGDAGWASSGAPARAVQDAVNAWIATGARNVDYRIDMYSVLVDPATPYTLLPAYDDGGHLHLTSAGYTAAGNAIYDGATWLSVKQAAAAVDGTVVTTGPVRLGHDLTVAGDVTLTSKLSFVSADPSFLLTTLDPATPFGVKFGASDGAITQNAASGEFQISAGRSAGWGGAITFVADTVERARITSAGLQTAGIVQPQTDNAHTLGTSSKRWSTVYATTGTINTSDERQKIDIEPSDLGIEFVRHLRPVSYRWRDGGTDVVRENGDVVETARPGIRRHYGLSAQQVRQALDQVRCADFAGWVLADKNDPNSLQSLRYDQFIAPLIKAVQELADQSTALRAEFDAYRSAHP